MEKPGFAIIQASSGVGYKVFLNNLDIAADKENVDLFIYEHLREDINDFYGFKNYESLELFQKLISVNGVGPKAGLGIMTVYSVDRIKNAIISEDADFFQTVPGIGKKVAAKIILELKGKIAGLESTSIIGKMSQGEEVVDALSSLGFKRGELAKIIGKIPISEKTLEEKVHWCLRNIKA